MQTSGNIFLCDPVLRFALYWYNCVMGLQSKHQYFHPLHSAKMVTNTYISIIYSFIKQDYIQGSSSSSRKLVACCFHITVHREESLAVGHASLKLRQAEALCYICFATGTGVLLRHPL